MNILFTCAGRRNYLINYFKKALQPRGKVLAADMQLSAPALVDADLAFRVSSIYASSYIEELKQIIKNNDVNLVVSLNDLELPILSKHREELEQYGAKLVVSSERVIDICFDKKKTEDFLLSIGLNSPKTFTDLQLAKGAIAKGELKYPLVLKPRWGSASIGIEFPEDAEEMELAYKLLSKRLSRTILANASNTDIEHAILIQQKLPGIEFGMDVLNDFEGNYVGTFVRKKLAMRSGETDKAISIIDERFEMIGRRISEQLKHIGNLDCDVFEVDGELYVLEMNPRFGGGYPFSHETGANTAEAYVGWMMGERDVSKSFNYRADEMYSKCDRLMRVG
jgi:carbamoyl-phosphate synthase large subunit